MEEMTLTICRQCQSVCNVLHSLFSKMGITADSSNQFKQRQVDRTAVSHL